MGMVLDKEEELLDIAKGLERSGAPAGSCDAAQIAREYKDRGEKVYSVTAEVTEDDETEKEFSFIFRRPKTASYDRYVKTMSSSVTKASKAFVLDNVVSEQAQELESAIGEYPAIVISIASRLLSMLGLSDFTAVKKL